MSDTATETDLLAEAFSAEWLMSQRFPPVVYAVDGIVPEGLTLLVAPPKLGKSWLVLDIALSISVGGRALGTIAVDRRPVLYLALEDGPRRLQNRLETLGAAIGAPDLEFMTGLNGHPLATIAAYLDRRGAERPLVIVDTLGKIKGLYGGNDKYAHDYAQAAALKSLVDASPGSSMVVVHHSNKGSKDDFVDSVSGTHGIAGAADTVITLNRERHDGAGTINVTSRDAAEGQYAATFSAGRWTLDGSTLAEAAQAIHQRQAVEGLGDAVAELVEVIYQHPEGIRRKELEALVDMEPGTLGKNLRRAVDAGRIASPSRGLYTPATNDTSAITTSQNGVTDCGRQSTSATFPDTHPDGSLTNVAHVSHMAGVQGIDSNTDGGTA